MQSDDGYKVVALARAERLDLVLMDIQLPHVSGLDDARRLKADAELGSISVVVLTGFAMKEDEARLRTLGCDGAIAKPISVDQLLKTVAPFVG